MDIKQIKQLVKLMIENDLTELDIADGDDKIHLKRGSEGQQPAAVTVLPPVPAPPAGAAAAPQAKAEAPQVENLIEIRSPMVGTFYATSSPDGDPYVDVGDSVDEDSVVCIVEAMKVMNEIKADCSGTIAEVCVKNVQPVEFGQILFRVRPASEK